MRQPYHKKWPRSIPITPRPTSPIDPDYLADFFDNWDNKPYPEDTHIQKDLSYRHQEAFNKFQTGQDYSLHWLPENLDHKKIKEALNEFRGINKPQEMIQKIFNFDRCCTHDNITTLIGRIYELIVALELKKKNPDQVIRFSTHFLNPPDTKKDPIEIDIETDTFLIECKLSLQDDNLEYIKHTLHLRKLIANAQQKKMMLIVPRLPDPSFSLWLRDHDIALKIVPISFFVPTSFFREISDKKTSIIKAEFDKFTNKQEFSLDWIPEGLVDKRVLKESLQLARNIPGSIGTDSNPINDIFNIDPKGFDAATYLLAVTLALDKHNYPILKFTKEFNTHHDKPAEFCIQTDKYLIVCKPHLWQYFSANAFSHLLKVLDRFQIQATQNKKSLILCCADTPPKELKEWLQEKGIPLVVLKTANDYINLDDAVQKIKNTKLALPLASATPQPEVTNSSAAVACASYQSNYNKSQAPTNAIQSQAAQENNPALFANRQRYAPATPSAPYVHQPQATNNAAFRTPFFYQNLQSPAGAMGTRPTFLPTFPQYQQKEKSTTTDNAKGEIFAKQQLFLLRNNQKIDTSFLPDDLKNKDELLKAIDSLKMILTNNDDNLIQQLIKTGYMIKIKGNNVSAPLKESFIHEVKKILIAVLMQNDRHVIQQLGVKINTHIYDIKTDQGLFYIPHARTITSRTAQAMNLFFSTLKAHSDAAGQKLTIIFTQAVGPEIKDMLHEQKINFMVLPYPDSLIIG